MTYDSLSGTELAALPLHPFHIGIEGILLEDSAWMHERPLAAGVASHLHVWPGLWHNFVTDDAVAASKLAIAETARFIQRALDDATLWP
jgi:acetyl esterase/lipase